MPTLSSNSRLSLLVAATILSVGCAGRTPVPATTPLPPTIAAASDIVPPAQSIFDLNDTWHSQLGGVGRFSSMRGGLLVVGVINTSCTASCATTVAAMKAVERATESDVHFVLVALNSENNSPEALASFAKSRHLPAERYTIISGNPAAIASLAGVLDVRHLNVTAGQLEASSMLSVIDGNGVLVQQRGYGSVTEVIDALALLSEIIR